MPTYQLLTDRSLAQSSAITPTTLIHIVYTGDPSQNIAGSSYKAELQQLSSIFSTSTFSGGSGNCITDLYVTNIHGCSPITIYDSIRSTGTTVSGLTSFSFGFETSATTDYSFAIGAQTLASGPYSHADGILTISSGSSSHAEGILTVAAEWGAHAEGGYFNGSNLVPGGKALAWGSHAEGTLTIASGVSSHAEGILTVALGWGSHSEGGYVDGGLYSGGTAIGKGSHAEGQETISSGTSSHAEGWLTNSSGSYSHAEGQLTLSLGQSSHAEGQNTISSGDWSHAEGTSTIASGYWSHAEGSQTISSGDFSHAEGFGTLADGSGSHAEGGYFLHPTYVSGGTALGKASHAEGVKTTAYGIASHAEGDQTYSFGFGSHAEGQGTYTSGSYQHATGKWNLTADTTSGAFIIGNGTNSSNRSNLLFAGNSGVTIYGTLSAATYLNLPLGNYGSGLTFNVGTYDLSLDGGNGVLDTINLGILTSDLTITGGTYNNGTGVATFTNNTGGTFNVTGFLVGYTDTLVTGATYSNNSFTFTNSTGGTFNVLFNTVTGLTSTGTISANTISATTYQNTPTALQVACSDEVTALVTGNTTTFRMPYNMNVTEVRGSLTTAQTAGGTFTVDILNNGTTILSTLITIDNSLKTSKTSAIQPVVSTANLVDDSEMVVKITQIGNGTARGLKVTILGNRS
jgi:hypothetical protein